MNILDYIPYGRDNAVSRQALAALTGLEDRMIRKEINRLREKGEFILSSSHSVGYWRSDDPKEIEDYLKECDSRRRHLAFPAMKKRFYTLIGKKYTVVKEHIRRIG